MSSDLTFRSLTYFVFIFVYDMRKSSNFTLHEAVQFSKLLFLKKHIFFLWYIFVSFAEDYLSVYDYIWIFCSVPLICVSVFVQVACFFITVAL